MKKYDSGARYDDDLNHWVRKEGHIYTIGITDFTQDFLGPLSNISQLPQPNQLYAKGAMYAIIETTKATNEMFLPIGGKVTAINPLLLQEPTWINNDCYGKGWVVQLEDVNITEWEDLLTAEEYFLNIKSFFNKG